MEVVRQGRQSPFRERRHEAGPAVCTAEGPEVEPGHISYDKIEDYAGITRPRIK